MAANDRFRLQPFATFSLRSRSFYVCHTPVLSLSHFSSLNPRSSHSSVRLCFSTDLTIVPYNLLLLTSGFNLLFLSFPTIECWPNISFLNPSHPSAMSLRPTLSVPPPSTPVTFLSLFSLLPLLFLCLVILFLHLILLNRQSQLLLPKPLLFPWRWWAIVFITFISASGMKMSWILLKMWRTCLRFLSFSHLIWRKNSLIELLQNQVHTFFRKQVRDVFGTLRLAKFGVLQGWKVKCIVWTLATFWR